MTEFLLGLLVGGSVGAASVALTGRGLSLRRAQNKPLTDDDRDQLATEFEVHAQGMRQQVDAFAEHLAGDDVLLRERLRRLQGGSW